MHSDWPAAMARPLASKVSASTAAGRPSAPRDQVIFLCAFAAFFLALFNARDLGADLLDAVASIGRDGGREFVARAGLRAPVVRKLREPGARALFVEAPVGNPLVEQLALEVGEPGPQCVTAATQLVNLLHQRGVPVAIGRQRLQPFDLGAGLQHCFMRPIEVVKVRDQRIDARLHRERFEHVLAHEFRQVTHRFHRDRLVEQIHRLLRPDTEAAPEIGAVRREAVMQRHTSHGAQPLAQLGDVAAEAREVLGDGQRAFSHHIETFGLAARILEPEYLRERDRLLITLVAEFAEQYRIAAVIAQRDGARSCRYRRART